MKQIWSDSSEDGSGSVLVFLPGFHEIRELGDRLIAFFKDNNLTPLYDENSAVPGTNRPYLYFITIRDVYIAY